MRLSITRYGQIFKTKIRGTKIRTRKSQGRLLTLYLPPLHFFLSIVLHEAVADPGGVPRGPCPPSPVQISHKKDGRQRRPHRFHVSCPPPPHPAAGSDAVSHQLQVVKGQSPFSVRVFRVGEWEKNVKYQVHCGGSRISRPRGINI